MKIQQLHKIDRPREKLMRYGPDKLSDEEIIATLLRTGIKGKDVLKLSGDVVKILKDSYPAITFTELVKVKGLGLTKISTILAALELGKRLLLKKETRLLLSAEDVWNACNDVWHSKREHFFVFMLDPRNQIIKRQVISVGTLDSSIIHPREVFENAVKNYASQIILAHNHPSGALEPSVADLQVTKRLVAAGQILGIEVIDHIIVTNKHWYSFKDDGLIDIRMER